MYAFNYKRELFYNSWRIVSIGEPKHPLEFKEKFKNTFFNTKYLSTFNLT